MMLIIYRSSDHESMMGFSFLCLRVIFVSTGVSCLIGASYMEPNRSL